MFLKTRHFGEIEIDENKIIRFDDGLPGFNHVREFIILDTESDESLGNKSSGKCEWLNNKSDAESDTAETNEEQKTISPFKWLQCVDDPMLAFAIADPFLLKPDYEVELSDEVVEYLEIKEESDVVIYAIVVVPEDITKMTMNLKAPLVINVRNKKGVQAILDTDEYSIRHYIMDGIRNSAADNTMNDTAGREV